MEQKGTRWSCPPARMARRQRLPVLPWEAACRRSLDRVLLRADTLCITGVFCALCTTAGAGDADSSSALKRAAILKASRKMSVEEVEIATLEREQIPVVGPSNDRRVFVRLTQHYNEVSTCSIVCFVCGQAKATTPGANSAIEYVPEITKQGSVHHIRQWDSE